jgi:hypothetical protein
MKPSRACETPRTDGWWGWVLTGAMPLARVAKRDGNPKEGAPNPKGRGAGKQRKELCRGAKLREDEPVFVRERGTASGMNCGSRQKWRGRRRGGESNISTGLAHINTL